MSWARIEEKPFRTPRGEIGVKYYKPLEDLPTRETKTLGRDLTLIAHDELGSVFAAPEILEANAGRLAEYDYDVSRFTRLEIPL